MHDRACGLLVTAVNGLMVSEPPAATASQRRLLHRAGFRRVGDRRRLWEWTPPEPSPSELGPPLSLTLAPRICPLLEASRRDLARDRARATMALCMLRDVCTCTPEHLALVVAVDDEDWDDDEAGELPPVDYQALEKGSPSVARDR